MPVDRDLLTTVQHVRRTLAEVGPESIRADGDFERVPLPSQDCDALRDLLVADNAEVVIEIGLAYGSSARAIGEGHPAVPAEARDADRQALLVPQALVDRRDRVRPEHLFDPRAVGLDHLAGEAALAGVH